MNREFLKRVNKELANLQQSCPHEIELLPTDNLQVVQAVIPGPEQSLYKEGKFKVQIYLPEQYPYEHPSVQFLTPIYHVNVSQSNGGVCLGFLQADNWNPTKGILDILNALVSIMIKPEVQNAFDHDVLNKFQHFTAGYNRHARESARKAK